MSVNCYTCRHHTQDKNKHTCKKCTTKEVYGPLQEQILEYCTFYEMTDLEAKRVATIERRKREPIDDSILDLNGKRRNERHNAKKRGGKYGL